MFERFTRDARALIKDAEHEAWALGSTTIEAEHLLLALTRLDPLTAAGAALAELGLDHDAAIDALDRERERSLMSVGVSIADFEVPTTPPLTWPRMAAGAKSALEHALRISLVRGDRRIEPGHILLALLRAEAGTVPRALQIARIDKVELSDRTAAALDQRKAR